MGAGAQKSGRAAAVPTPPPSAVPDLDLNFAIRVVRVTKILLRVVVRGPRKMKRNSPVTRTLCDDFETVALHTST